MLIIKLNLENRYEWKMFGSSLVLGHVCKPGSITLSLDRKQNKYRKHQGIPNLELHPKMAVVANES
jgi:hypothetical protein